MSVSVIVPMTMVVVMVAGLLIVALIRLGLQPALNLQGLGRRVVEAGIEKQGRRYLSLHHPVKPGCGIQVAQAALQNLQAARRPFVRAFVRDKIGFGDQDPVSDGGLLYRFNLAVQRGRAVYRIHRGDHAVQAKTAGQQRIGHQGLKDRGGVGQAGGLYHHALEGRYVAAHPLFEEPAQGIDKIAAHRAAKTAAVHQHRVLVDLLDQQVVEPDLAKLVDDYRRFIHLRMTQEVAQ